MAEITKPFTFDDLPTRPPITGRPKVSDDLQQTLALQVGWDGITRRLIRCSPTGAIRQGSARAKAVINILADQDDYVLVLPDIVTSEVMLRAFPDNTARVFININAAASLNTGYPLNAGEWVSLSVDNLLSVQVYVEKNAEKIGVIYTD